jgi:hypothetical protein
MYWTSARVLSSVAAGRFHLRAFTGKLLLSLPKAAWHWQCTFTGTEVEYKTPDSPAMEGRGKLASSLFMIA